MSYQITEVFVSIQTLSFINFIKKYSTLFFVKTEPAFHKHIGSKSGHSELEVTF